MAGPTTSAKAATAMASDEALDRALTLGRKQLATLPPAKNHLPVVALTLLDDDKLHRILIHLSGSPSESLRICCTDEAATADVSIRVSVSTCNALLSGKLSVIKAFTQKAVIVERGKMSDLRAVGERLAPLASAFANSSPSAVRVHVLHADVSDGHGEYVLRVSEGATSWLTRRRWRELKALRSHLLAHYGPSTPCKLPVPPLPRTLFSGSSSPSILSKRPAQIEAWMAQLLSIMFCSPQAGSGPPALLAFLGAAGDSEQDACSPPPPLTPMTTPPRTSSQASSASGDCLPSSPPLEDFTELLHLRRADLHKAALEALHAKVRQSNTFAASSVIMLACVLLSGQRKAIAPDSFLSQALPVPRADAGTNADQGNASSQTPDAAMHAAGTEWRPTPLWPAEPLLLMAILSVALLPRLLSLLATAVWSCVPTRIAARLVLLRRYAIVCALFVRVVVRYKYTKAWRCRGKSSEYAEGMWAEYHEWMGALLFREIMKLGGLWLKIGQYIASRSDFVPDMIIAHLSKMLDANPHRPLAEVLDTLTASWGATAEQCLERLEPTALSCGSIAQVHVGWMRTPAGQLKKVAVKVQHSDIGPTMLQDLRQCDVLSAVLAWLEPNFDFRPVLREINQEHKKELDFAMEVTHVTLDRVIITNHRLLPCSPCLTSVPRLQAILAALSLTALASLCRLPSPGGQPPRHSAQPRQEPAHADGRARRDRGADW